MSLFIVWFRLTIVKTQISKPSLVSTGEHKASQLGEWQYNTNCASTETQQEDGQGGFPNNTFSTFTLKI